MTFIDIYNTVFFLQWFWKDGVEIRLQQLNNWKTVRFWQHAPCSCHVRRQVCNERSLHWLKQRVARQH